MNRSKTLLLLVAALVAASCAPVDTPPPAVTPLSGDPFLVDPRTGFEGTAAPAVTSRFETAWRWVLSGNEVEARRRLTELTTRNPEYTPAVLATAAVDIMGGRFDEARTAIARVLAENPNYLAARVYEAEIAYRQNQTRAAYDLYRALANDPGAPAFTTERIAELQDRLFNELFAAAQSAGDDDAIPLLREALTFNPNAVEPRILLAQKLVARKDYDAARLEIDPLLDTAADRAEVQELLAEIEAGRGRFQEAIVRYERLARRTRDPRHERRLEEIKQEWSAANMPAHFRTALESDSITRAQFATLLYWTVPPVRFAQNLPTPPIAIDIESVAGREEIIRAIAIGLYDVDPVTRRVSPFRQVTASRLATHLQRLLTLRAARCAQGIEPENVLTSCGITNPLEGRDADDPITGREAQRLLSQVAKAL